jgi:hypothetical protein
MTLQKVGHRGMAMVKALSDVSPAALEVFSNRMPSRIEDALDFPIVRELIAAAGEENVKAYLEFELVKLANLVSVGGNLNNSQVVFIASELIKIYPNETLADFKLCFHRGAIGQYGEVYRMDGIVIRSWMEKYLEEKYQVIENKLMSEKDTGYTKWTPMSNSQSDQNPTTHAEKVKRFKELFPSASPAEIEVMMNRTADEWIKEAQKAIDNVSVKPVSPITDKEINQEGRIKPAKKEPYKNGFELHRDNQQVLIQRTASEFYKNKYTFSGFQNFLIDGFNIFAETEEDAILIYNNAVGK